MGSRIFDLPVMAGRQQSFYGKAKVIEYENGEKALQSYNTTVCKITTAGEFVRLWDGSNATTLRHVQSFCKFYGIEGGSLSWWRSLEVA